MPRCSTLLVIVSPLPRSDAIVLAREYDLIWCGSWREAAAVLGLKATQRFLLLDSIGDHEALNAMVNLIPHAEHVHTVVAADRPRWLRAELRERGLFAEVLRAPVSHHDLLPRIGFRVPEWRLDPSGVG